MVLYLYTDLWNRLPVASALFTIFFVVDLRQTSLTNHPIQNGNVRLYQFAGATNVLPYRGKRYKGRKD